MKMDLNVKDQTLDFDIFIYPWLSIEISNHNTLKMGPLEPVNIVG